jgi:hypothetical protein
MRRIGYFSIRGYWHSPLAVFAIVVVGGLAVPGGHSLGIRLLGLGVASSSIIAYILSITATLNQNIVEMMHEVDSSLQPVDYSFDVWGNSRLKLNSTRGEWQIYIQNSGWARMEVRGPNGLYRVMTSGAGFKTEVREMMENVGSVTAGA